ncbi:MAG: DEAD/DEAH box helicase [Pseudomonadota bacterium]
MKTFYMDLSSKIIDDKNYLQATDQLFSAYVSKSVNEEYKIADKLIRQLSNTIQYLYFSDVDNFLNEGAILLSMLLYLVGDKTPELIAIAENLFFSSGDFPNVKLLKDMYQDVPVRLSLFDETRKDIRQELNTIDEVDHPLTDYQRTLWEDLTSDIDVITSAPTSTGKTHIILRYLMHKLENSDGAFAAVVVPTRALISELSGKLYEIAKKRGIDTDIEICTVPKEGPFSNKTFFVMTQERLFEVLQTGDLYFNYLFVDEAHNISDKSRGVLLHLTLQKMLEDSNPQIIISMPSPLYQNAFDSVFYDIEFSKKKTQHSPVAKIIMDVSLKGKKINISRVNCDRYVSINKEFSGTKIANIVYRLGQGECNIIYRNKTNHCEDVAQEIAILIKDYKSKQALDEAADYIENFLHKDFTLASNLKKGVAFHYGPLPGVVRTMIENLVRNGDVNYVVCTSTLAEGVNLPAKNLFLKNPIHQPPYKPTERLETVTLNNITGRAGRMLEHFAGNIFLIEPEKWTYKDYFEETQEEPEKIPTYFKVLNDNLEFVIDALEGNYDHDDADQYSYYTIANKLLKEYSSSNLSMTLNADQLTLDQSSIERLENQIKKAYDNLKVDTFTLEANPTVGFIQQNKLYNTILNQDDLSEWILPHPKSTLLYKRLEKVCNVLYDAGIFLPQKAYSIAHACAIARKWIIGEPLKNIISEQIIKDNEKGKDYNCNRSVRDVITVINNDIRFRMSSALKCYHSLITDVISVRKLGYDSTKMYSYIEVGGCDSRVINLVNFGLSRETSLEIDRILPAHIEIETFETLKILYEVELFKQLHVITKNEIENLLL